MPLYTYQCKSCDHTFDQSNSINDRKAPETQPCPECGQHEVQLIIAGRAGIVYRDKDRTSSAYKERIQHINTDLGTRMPSSL